LANEKVLPSVSAKANTMAPREIKLEEPLDLSGNVPNGLIREKTRTIVRPLPQRAGNNLLILMNSVS